MMKIAKSLTSLRSLKILRSLINPLSLPSLAQRIRSWVSTSCIHYCQTCHLTITDVLLETSYPFVSTRASALSKSISINVGSHLASYERSTAPTVEPSKEVKTIISQLATWMKTYNSSKIKSLRREMMEAWLAFICLTYPGSSIQTIQSLQSLLQRSPIPESIRQYLDAMAYKQSRNTDGMPASGI